MAFVRNLLGQPCRYQPLLVEVAGARATTAWVWSKPYLGPMQPINGVPNIGGLPSFYMMGLKGFSNGSFPNDERKILEGIQKNTADILKQTDAIQASMALHACQLEKGNGQRCVIISLQQRMVNALEDQLSKKIEGVDEGVATKEAKSVVIQEADPTKVVTQETEGVVTLEVEPAKSLVIQAEPWTLKRFFVAGQKVRRLSKKYFKKEEGVVLVKALTGLADDDDFIFVISEGKQFISDAPVIFMKLRTIVNNENLKRSVGKAKVLVGKSKLLVNNVLTSRYFKGGMLSVSLFGLVYFGYPLYPYAVVIYDLL